MVNLMELLVVVLTSILVLYFWVRKRQRYFEDRGIPYVKPVFLLGNTYKNLLGKERIGETLLDIYKESKGHKIVGIFQALKPIFVLRDPGVVQQVMVSDFSSYHSHGFVEVDEEVNPLEAHLFNLEGEKWRLMRKKLSPTFTSGKLKWMFPQMGVCSVALMKTLDEELDGRSKDVEIRDLISRYTTDVIASCAFGLEPASIKDKDSKFRKVGKRIFSPGLKEFLLFGFRQAFPEAFRWLKMKAFPDEVSDFFNAIVKGSFEERLRTGHKRNDFVQLLLQLREKGSVELDPRDAAEDDEHVMTLDDHHLVKLEMTDEVLTAQAFVFFAAGFETTATTLSFLMFELAKRPDVQEKIREEVRRVKEKHEGEISYDALKEMTYLEACISESLRLHPPVEIHFRKSNRVALLDGIHLPEGTQMLISVLGLHTDPDYWEDPLAFKPERFLREETVLPGTYLPFGSGPRICIGRRFALVEVKLSLAKILEAYEIGRSPKTKDGFPCNPWSFVPQPLDGLWVRFRKLGSPE